MTTTNCCAECGVEGGVSLKVCKSCMQAKYCNATCQHKHWPKHKKDCKLRAAELRDEALFKDPPPKEECPICFLPMSINLICCASLPPATILSIPIDDFANANEELAKMDTAIYYPCCGKIICGGCIYSFSQSGNDDKCPFCNSDQGGKTDEEKVGEIMKRVEANDTDSIFLLAGSYYHGKIGLQQDHTKAIELYTKAAGLGSSKAHCALGVHYYKGGDLKKAKFHYETAAMAGHEVARTNIGVMESQSGNLERAIQHWMIAASSGHFPSMHLLILFFQQDSISQESINSTLTAYNHSCAEMRSEARDAYINMHQVLCQLQGVGAVGGRPSPTAVYKSLIEHFKGMEAGGRQSQGVSEDAIVNSIIKLGMAKKAQAEQRAEEALSQKVEVEQKNVVEQLEDDKKRM
jgi:hypothetical protein